MPVRDVLLALKESLDVAEVLVGHNLQFDVSILENDTRAARLALTLHDFPKICTMRASTTWCRISKLNGKRGFKWPTLTELHRRCFGYEFDGAHDALSDVEATKRCFFKLIDLGVIASPERKSTTLQSKSSAHRVARASVDAALGASNVRRSKVDSAALGRSGFGSQGSTPPKKKIQLGSETACPYCKQRLRLPLGVRGRATCRACCGSFYVNRTFATALKKGGIPQEISRTGHLLRRVPCGCCGQMLRIPYNRRGLATCPKCEMKTLFNPTEW